MNPLLSRCSFTDAVFRASAIFPKYTKRALFSLHFEIGLFCGITSMARDGMDSDEHKFVDGVVVIEVQNGVGFMNFNL